MRERNKVGYRRAYPCMNFNQQYSSYIEHSCLMHYNQGLPGLTGSGIDLASKGKGEFILASALASVSTL